jgi:hypothetical protein
MRPANAKAARGNDTPLRQAAVVYGMALVELLPDGPDKTWVIRNHRTTAMWADVVVGARFVATRLRRHSSRSRQWRGIPAC